ncbi:MAG: putative acyltransferase/Predicted acyltransferase [Verrucomicrobia bacterium]|nr:MAG: putative acyltransferase/Predicted acyltransferase [Verrucomicrobiota bacterium]
MSTSPVSPPDASVSPRLLSVDALRGFDMFWIIGGEQVAKALEKAGDGPLTSIVATQLQHVEWDGFRFYDGIFPLFLFLIGVSIVLSMDRLITTAGRRGALTRIVRRSLLLFVIGVFYYGGLSQTWPDVQLSGVLPRIALCYLAAATLYLFLPRQGIVMAAVACLAGYWALLMFVPFPDVNLKHDTIGKKGSQSEAKPLAKLFPPGAPVARGTFEEGRNLTHYVDAVWLPGKKRNLYYSSEGLLSTLPAVATTLFGIMAGWLLTSSSISDKRKVALLLAAGAGGIVLGCLWGLQFPIIKRLWTSSFCLVASGFSAMMLGMFYLLVDVWRRQRWCAPFLWIGSNALVAYLAVNLVDFPAIAARLGGGNVQAFLDAYLAKGIGGLAVALLGLLLPVLLVRFLYQRKIFIRL